MNNTIKSSQSENDANNNSSAGSTPVPNPFQIHAKVTRWQKQAAQHSAEQTERNFPRFIFDPDSVLVCYWTAVVALATLYNAWTIALRIAFPEMREKSETYYLTYIDIICDLIYLLDIGFQLRTAYLLDGIPVFDPTKIRHQYISQTCFIQDVIAVLPSQSVFSLIPDNILYCKYFLCTAGGARLNKLLKFHILYKFYDLAESFTSNPHLIRVLRLFLNLAIIIHWIACLYYLLSEYEGLGSNEWVYSNATEEQRFSRKYIRCLYWSAMTLTTIGDTNTPETDVEYIFTGLIFMTGVFVFATVMGNVGDVISSMNANRQEFQARMDHIQMYLTHKKVPASLQLKIKKWAEYTWSRTKATDESRLLNMLPERLRAEVAVHVHLDSLKKVKIFEQCETGFLCELVLKLRSQVFSPGDYVCRVGETGREMFIINHGKVEVIVNNPATNKPMVVAILSEGNYFGEISLLRLDGVQNSSFFNRRTADVRSIGYSELLCLSRRDLMSALVEYPEAKSVLEDQAKKRMKTNLQAQRAFSVDTLLRNSQESSSVDSGISRDEGGEVSEIKAMIEELKNANKVPGRTVWQLIARCEVLQAKLGEKEKEIDDSKHRIRDLEHLLFSRHSRKVAKPPADFDDPEPNPERLTRCGGSRVVKQFSQEEGRRVSCESPDSVIAEGHSVPQVKITRPASEGESSAEDHQESNRHFQDSSAIKTSKITNIFEKGTSLTRELKNQFKAHASSSGMFEEFESRETPDRNHYSNNFKVFHENVWNVSSDYTLTKETLIDHQITFDDDDEFLLTTEFRNEIRFSDSLNLDVHTIPEENEEEVSKFKEESYSAKDTQQSSINNGESSAHNHNSSTSAFKNNNGSSALNDKGRSSTPNNCGGSSAPNNNDRSSPPNCNGGSSAHNNNGGSSILNKNESSASNNNVSPNSSYNQPDDQQSAIARTCSFDNLPAAASCKEDSVSGEDGSSTIKRMKSAPGELSRLDTLSAGDAIQFIRMSSVSSGFSDDSNSRRNSWTWGSEEVDSEDDDTSS